jgi:putative hydrolase of the HAD superfamily
MEVQERKVTALGLRTYLDRISICSTKTSHEYRVLMSEVGVGAADAWAVGNSVRSDINPAIQAGMRAILIPRGTWRYEEQQTEPGDVIVVSSLLTAAHSILVGDEAPVIATA